MKRSNKKIKRKPSLVLHFRNRLNARLSPSRTIMETFFFFRTIHHDLIEEVLMFFGSELFFLFPSIRFIKRELSVAFKVRNRNQQRQQQKQHGIKINREIDVYEPP